MRARRLNTTITGLRELRDMFDNMIDEAKDILDDATKQATQIVKNKAEQKIKVLTGEMKTRLYLKQNKCKKDTKKAWSVGCKDPGAASLESGNSKMPAQPFLRPSLDRSKTEIQDKISEVITRRLGV